jgi:CyaY protein
VDEREFLVQADAELARIEAVLEQLSDEGSVDFDYELKPGGIIELVFEDASKIIVNRHGAAREIWVAGRSGGFHFKPPAEPGGAWTASRDGQTLADVLSRCFSEQANAPVRLDWA